MSSRLSAVGDPSVGEWIAPRMGAWGSVGGVVPEGFASYARVLHPATDRSGQRAGWAAVCAATGRVPHALMQWQSISRSSRETGEPAAVSGGWDGRDPEVGGLETQTLRALCDVLAAQSSDAAPCYVALWDGWGWIHGGSASGLLRSWPVSATQPTASTFTPSPPAFPAEVLAGPRLHLPGRGYLVFSGPLGAALELGDRPTADWFLPQSPNILWPADRSWCVATEIDFDSTLVAGSSALVQAVLADPYLEAWRVRPGDSLGFDDDTVNV